MRLWASGKYKAQTMKITFYFRKNIIHNMFVNLEVPGKSTMVGLIDTSFRGTLLPQNKMALFASNRG